MSEIVTKQRTNSKKERLETEEKWGRAEQSRDNLRDGRRPLCLARAMNEKKPLCGCVHFSMCVSLCSIAGWSAPSRPCWCWMQSRQHQAKANDYKASSVTVTQAATGEWPYTATQTATVHYNASQQEVQTFPPRMVHIYFFYINANAYFSESNSRAHLGLLILFNSKHCYKLSKEGHRPSTRQQDPWSAHTHTHTFSPPCLFTVLTIVYWL